MKLLTIVILTFASTLATAVLARDGSPRFLADGSKDVCAGVDCGIGVCAPQGNGSAGCFCPVCSPKCELCSTNDCSSCSSTAGGPGGATASGDSCVSMTCGIGTCQNQSNGTGTCYCPVCSPDCQVCKNNDCSTCPSAALVAPSFAGHVSKSPVILIVAVALGNVVL